jgi:hypothetical protein
VPLPVELERPFLLPMRHTDPAVLMSTQYMVLFLDLWSAVILGILYLSFGGVPYVFKTQYDL